MEHPTWEELTDFFDKRLLPDRQADIEAHITVCDECSEQIEWLYKSIPLLRADSFAPPPRRVRVTAESLFDLRYGKVTGSTVAVPSESTTASPSPVAGDKIIPLPPRTDRTAEEKVIRPAPSYWRRFAWVGGAVAALLVLAIFASQAQRGPLVAAVQGQQGQVDIVSPDNSLNLPFNGNALNEGSAVTTGADGSAQLVFANGTVRVTMLEDSNLVYIGGTESDGSLSRLALATDQAGDLEIDAQSGVTVDLQTGVGLFTTTGGRYRFHYLEPRIVGVQVLRGTVTVRSERGVYEMHEGEEEILDYTLPVTTPPVTTPTPEPTMTPSPTVPPTATAVPPTPTRLPTRLPPSPTTNGSSVAPQGETNDDSGEEEPESETEAEDGSTSTSPSELNNGGTGAAVATNTPNFTATSPSDPPNIGETTTTPEEPAEPDTTEPNSDEDVNDNSGSGNNNDDDDSDEDEEDNSGSGSGNSGSGNSGSGGGDEED